MPELLYFLLAVSLMLGTMILTSLAIVMIFKFSPEVPDENVIEKPRS